MEESREKMAYQFYGWETANISTITDKYENNPEQFREVHYA